VSRMASEPVCLVQALCLLPDDLHNHVLETLNSEEKRVVRCVSRRARKLVNRLVTDLRLNSEAIDYLSQPWQKPLHSRFGSLQSITLADGQEAGGQDGFLQVVGDIELEAVFNQQMPTVRHLSLKRTAFLSPAGTTHMLHIFPNLASLAASRWVTASSLLDVTRATSITHLDLGDAEVDILGVDNCALSVVARCVQLKSLSLQRCVAMTDAGLATLMASLPNLTTLNISATRVNGSGLAATPHPALTTLDACGCPGLGDSQLPGIAAALPRLATLRVAACSVTNAGLVAAAPHLSKLTELDLGPQFEVSDAGLRALAASAASLNTLTLGNFNVSAVGAAAAAAASVPGRPRGLPALRQLKFGGAFANRGLRHVVPLGPQLARVQAWGFETVVDTTVAALARQTSLEVVELSGGYTLTCAGLRGLAVLPRLHTLLLSGCPLIQEVDAARLVAASPALRLVELRKSSHDTGKGVAISRCHPLVMEAAAELAAAAAAAGVAEAGAVAAAAGGLVAVFAQEP